MSFRITPMKKAGESDQSGASGERPEPWGDGRSHDGDWFPRLMKLMFTSGLTGYMRYSHVDDSVFFDILVFQVLAGCIIFWGICVLINYVSFNIDIAPPWFLNFILFPDWTRQHPATNSGTGSCRPFFSTSHYFQAQLATVFHRAPRP